MNKFHDIENFINKKEKALFNLIKKVNIYFLKNFISFNLMKKINLSDIPESPGVYIFLDEKSNVLYVGKAKNLKKRVSSYFTKNNKQLKTELILKNFSELKYIITENEVEALLLEANLIKNEKPKYNILLKDSKSYPYLKITDDEYPKIVVTRKIDDKGKYIGPFVNVSDVRGILREILKLFPVRTCSESKFKKKKLCINYQIKRCSGPCENRITKEHYLKYIKNIISIFSGEIDKAKKFLHDEMIKASKNLNFEQAAVYRDRLKGLEKFHQSQVAVLDIKSDMDIFYHKKFEQHHLIGILFIRNGKIIGFDNFIFQEMEEPEFISFILQFYSKNRLFPDKIIANLNSKENNILLSNALKNMFNKKITVLTEIEPKIINFIEKNLKVYLDKFIKKQISNENVLNEIKKRLKLSEIPNRIECIDISHFGGSWTVGVSIRFENGSFNKEKYRRYKFSNINNDDFKAIYELMKRKAKRLITNESEKADLYIIDGGKGQLLSAIRAFQELNIHANIVALAKGRSKKNELSKISEEEIYLPNRKNPVKFIKNSSELLFLQKIRDEAHRFAIEYQRTLALKSIKSSELLQIEGVGEKTAKKILTNMPDIFNKKDITTEELRKKCQISQKVAEKIVLFLKNRYKNEMEKTE